MSENTASSPPSPDLLSDIHALPARTLRSRATGTRFLAPTANLYNSSSKRMIQQVIVGTSTCTIILVLITFFFFLKMPQKRVRHKLVMLSILGCFIRGLWYFIFSIVVVSGKTVVSSTALCQATGFFLHVGNEMSDIATLLIAVHGALQIFRPSVSTLDLGDGLYEYQDYCYGAILILPIIIASISFVNTGPAYTQQGAFCSLPTSPIWYRLALSYAPRYLIALIVVCLSIAVYIHVELKFRSFAKLQRASRTSIAFPSGKAPAMGESPPAVREPLHHIEDAQQANEPRPILKMPNFGGNAENGTGSKPQSPNAEGQSEQDDTINEYFPQRTFPATTPPRKVSIATTVSGNTTSTSNKSRASLPGLATLKRTGSAIQRLASSSQSHVAPQLTALQKQAAERKALRRQLRLIFVYPIVYVVLWIPPCTLNAMQYSPKTNQHLPAWLGALSNVTLTLMGGIDCIVFFWREKPWRRSRNRASSNVSQSFGSRSDHGSKDLGSKDLEKADVMPNSATTTTEEGANNSRTLSKASIANTLTSLLPKKAKPSRSASTVAKQRAYERLALEIEDRRDQVRKSVDSIPDERIPEFVTNANDAEKSSVARPGPKHWWDRQDSVY